MPQHLGPDFRRASVNLKQQKKKGWATEYHSAV